MSGIRPRPSCRRHDLWNIADGWAVLGLGPSSLSVLLCKLKILGQTVGRILEILE